jgi:SAM-dependent methyltransferase
VSLCDVSGRACIIDYFGNVVLDVSVGLPAWGVCHSYQSDNTSILSIAAASKNPQSGRLVIFRDDRQCGSFDCNAPLWDVLHIPQSKVTIASGWCGTLYSVDHSTFQIVSIRSTDFPVFGLAQCGSQIAAVSERNGILLFSPESPETSTTIPVQSCVYNVAVSDTHDAMLSGTYGPYLHLLTRNGKELCKVDAEDVKATVFYDRVAIHSTSDGFLVLRLVTHFERELCRVHVGGDIWNIGCDVERQQIFAVVGDGSVCCFFCDLTADSIQRIETAIHSPPSRDIESFEQSLCAGVHPVLLIDTALEILKSETISADRTTKVLTTLRQYASESGGDYVLLLALFELNAGNNHAAIAALAKIDRSSSYFPLATILMARIHLANGDRQAARTCLVANLDSLYGALRDEATSILVQLGERLVSREETTSISLRQSRREPISRNLHSNSPKEVLATDVGLFLSRHVPAQSSDQRDVSYGIVNYIKYEFANPADTAKKSLEKRLVESIIGQIPKQRSGRPESLDIGCATCRYPLWFAELGYLAAGYDIDDEAIRICRAVADNKPNIRIEKRNILESPIEPNRYAIVTCMMGTYNHIPRIQHQAFGRWIYDSLRVGGLFLFSSWNRDCPYTTYLHFYNRTERESIRENCPAPVALEQQLKNIGFAVRCLTPFCFLPDDCYDAWLGSDNEPFAISTVDDTCRESLKGANSQMYLCVCEKV